MMRFHLGPRIAIVAAGLALACGAKPTEPSDLVGCEPVLDVAGAGENILLVDETRTLYGIVRHNTVQGCTPMADRRVGFGTSAANRVSLVQVNDTSARITGVTEGRSNLVVFLRARPDITVLLPFSVLPPAGEPIEDDGIVVD
jgi:hypothetical protein